MKKYMTMPDVKVVRFDNKDVIVTSGGFETTNEFEGYSKGGGFVQERRSIWDEE